MHHFCYLASSIIVSLSTYFISPYITKKISKNISTVYSSLSVSDQRNWNTRYVANLYALVIVPNVAYLLFRNDSLFYEDNSSLPSSPSLQFTQLTQFTQFTRTNDHTFAILYISLGYFISDLIMCINAKMLDFKILFHHIISIIGLVAACITGWFHYNVCFMLITESTTFFVMNRWWLDKLNMKHTKIYFYNGILMLISWFFARVYIFPLYFTKMYFSFDAILEELHKIDSGRHFLLISFGCFLAVFNAIVMCALNLTWFFMMLKGTMKMLYNNKMSTLK